MSVVLGGPELPSRCHSHSQGASWLQSAGRPVRPWSGHSVLREEHLSDLSGCAQLRQVAPIFLAMEVMVMRQRCAKEPRKGH